MAKKRGKNLPEGYSCHTIAFNAKSTANILTKQLKLKLLGKKRSVEQIVNSMVEEQIV